jgi:hypothetical protein
MYVHRISGLQQGLRFPILTRCGACDPAINEAVARHLFNILNSHRLIDITLQHLHSVMREGLDVNDKRANIVLLGVVFLHHHRGLGIMFVEWVAVNIARGP